MLHPRARVTAALSAGHLLWFMPLHQGQPVEGAMTTCCTCLGALSGFLEHLLLVNKDEEHFIPREISLLLPGPSFD
jgi:hypothetical protein